MSFWREAPPPEEVLQLSPEVLAPFILRYLQNQPPGRVNRYNFTLVNDQELVQRLGHEGARQYMECVMEAWMYLERQGFIAPQPGQDGSWMFVTRRGRAITDATDFESYKDAYLLNESGLDPVLLQKVRADFSSGEYDSAVFKAYKEVEVRVRQKAGYPNSAIGVRLMRDAFSPTIGPLTDMSAEPGERAARMELFAGSIGTYKNPSSHRDVGLEDPKEAADIIHSANQLLRIVSKIS